MFFKQFYLGCLAHASYLVGSGGEAAVVDPQRDVDQYVEEAAGRGLRIKYVVETHLHADFVSGHRELAARTGAEIVFGEKAQARFPHRAVRDGDELCVGKVILRVLETPGHTPESISVLVIDAETSPEPRMVLTGDTLFIGDVGRPDLAGARGFTTEMMADMLYESLHGKLLRLADSV
ncbi:MAG TPA: MBL fold metallo-hydrolase, partial [Pyrinomonadaceae bacterium]|nr:MBL fold metallo-hydrolase [Pyrinomonadaceae bacterium]